MSSAWTCGCGWAIPSTRRLATNNIAEVLSNQGHLEDAQRRFEEALRVWRAADFRMGVGYALGNLGRVAYRDGRHAEGLDLLERAREIFQAMRAAPEVVETDARRAECLVLQGASAEAPADRRRYA